MQGVVSPEQRGDEQQPAIKRDAKQQDTIPQYRGPPIRDPSTSSFGRTG